VRAIVFDQPGQPEDVLVLQDLSRPVPAQGDVLVRMIASPVNPSDLLYIRGQYGLKPKLPAIPGFEGVGIVVESGGGLLGWLRKGQRVAVLNEGGNWAEYTVVSARRVIPVPKDISTDHAATFFVNPATALVMTRELLRIPPGEWLLQTAAGSEVGKMIIRLGKRYRFRTINVVRRREQIDELKRLGADAVICDSDGSLADQVRSITGSGGVRFAVDPVGGETGTQVVASLSAGGRAVLYGLLSGKPISVDPRLLISGSKRIEGFWLADYMKNLPIVRILRLIRRVRRLIRDGVLATDIAISYPLEKIQDAVQHAAAPGKGGKVLLRIAEE
jgi:NADPH2:quinone reductase